MALSTLDLRVQTTEWKARCGVTLLTETRRLPGMWCVATITLYAQLTVVRIISLVARDASLGSAFEAVVLMTATALSFLMFANQWVICLGVPLLIKQRRGETVRGMAIRACLAELALMATFGIIRFVARKAVGFQTKIGVLIPLKQVALFAFLAFMFAVQHETRHRMVELLGVKVTQLHHLKVTPLMVWMANRACATMRDCRLVGAQASPLIHRSAINHVHWATVQAHFCLNSFGEGLMALETPIHVYPSPGFVALITVILVLGMALSDFTRHRQLERVHGLHRRA